MLSMADGSIGEIAVISSGISSIACRSNVAVVGIIPGIVKDTKFVVRCVHKTTSRSLGIAVVVDGVVARQSNKL